ncbi:ABC transporter ATP-binding protein [Terrisporobacter mayombei]|uniref:Bicarbonate transport ATP-binding protein CmpD n=1 Tax=Terrisporobacter mayombei TaxID=1541 RepID=A0ABY9Q6U0_9FIRM|nr:ABC transporter ATP-binding protein [Terrisporobacter mayombei]MCC3869766.1 ABC transporter ATP-binding protein [Terrisporobacter mayombei]WMT83294.1 Bicarbonate transport ATP-binding protein CmpD [Terrisporobacter mayombei]
METINKEDLISINNINKKFNEKVVFKNFNIDFYKNKVNCIIGKSGCGKSTLLNIISGIIPNDNENFETIEKYGVSYIFQEDRLVDWLTVGENITLVVKKLYNKKMSDELCEKYLDLVGIKEYKNYYPQMLSGGLRQRVNIARAFIYPSKIVIMDEPFKSIDVINKEIIMNNFKKILEREERTVLFVTHDIDEALLLSDKIYVLGNSPINIKKIIDKKDNIGKIDIYKLI